MPVMMNFSLAVNHSGCELELEDVGQRMPFFFFYLVITIVAIPANSFSLYVSWQHVRHRNELGVYLFNLALCDLTFTVGLSLWMDFLWRGVWIHGGHVCMLSVYLLFTNFYTSDALLCCIAVDRYMAVAHPFKYPSMRKVGTAVMVSITLWVLVVCFNAATITWEDSYGERDKVCFNIFPLSEKLTTINSVRFFVGFIAPVGLMTYCFWGICRAVESNRATEDQERKRVSRLLGMVLLSTASCFGPVHLMMLLRVLLGQCQSPEWLVYTYKVSVTFSSLNCLLDPLLYCFITKSGKANVTQVVHFIQGKKRVKGQGVV